MNAPKIILENIHKSFGPKQVLTGVDLRVQTGESWVILGPSGTGKSVLLKIILGLMSPDQGRVVFHTEHSHHPIRDIGMLFQGAALFDSLPIWHNVMFRLIHAKSIRKSKARMLAQEYLARVGLRSDVLDLYPADLSGGMKKRVGLARAIASEPQILLFDEPTTGLDPIASDLIDKLIIRCSKQLGATTLTITHDLVSARKIADKVAFLHAGQILWHGDISDLDQSGNPWVEQFVQGSSIGPIQGDDQNIGMDKDKLWQSRMNDTAVKAVVPNTENGQGNAMAVGDGTRSLPKASSAAPMETLDLA